MQSSRIDIFFSSSFREEDEGVNKIFLSICNALDIKCTNVNGAHTSVPPEVARKQIDEVQGLIAIGTKRDHIGDGKYAMPPAVLEELAMAYAKEIPILSFMEKDVQVDGMKGNFGTFMEFDREKLSNHDILEKIIKSIHDFKLEIVSPYDLIYDHDSPEIVTENVKQLIELKESNGDFIWSYTIAKKIFFTNTFKRHIPVTFWPSVNINFPDDAPNLVTEILLKNKSRDLLMTIDKKEETPSLSQNFIKFEPHPEKGDFVEYETYLQSKYLNPIHKKDLKSSTSLDLDNKSFECMDGFIPINRTQKASIEFRFPRTYGLKKENVRFFVGSYTNEIDYIVESEMSRAKLDISEIGGNLTVKIDLDSPLPRHVYGLAWNIPGE